MKNYLWGREREVLTRWPERNADLALDAADGHNVALPPFDHGGQES